MTTQFVTIGRGSEPPSAGGCSCCGPARTAGATDRPTSPRTASPKETAMTTTTYSVTGMTCGHCVAAVTEEIGKLPGVQDVTVDLVEGGASSVTVSSQEPLSQESVREAVDEAGYELTGSPS